MRNTLIAFTICALMAAYLRVTDPLGLGALVFFMAAALFAALVLVGLVPRIGHTPRGAVGLLSAAALIGWGVLWWAGEGPPLGAFVVAEEASVQADFAPTGPHPDVLASSEGR